MAVEYRLLGTLEALVDGRPVRLGPPRQQALLVLLLCHANAVVSASRLADDLWRGDPPASAANLVQGYVSGLRKALGREAIETRGAGYVVHVAPGTLDLERFEGLAQDGSRSLDAGDAIAASDLLGRALALWRGPVLAELDEPALDPVVTRLDELRTLARERQFEADLAQGRGAELVPELERLVHAHPLRERPYALLMAALYRAGRQAEALDVYHRARTTLLDELGLEPSALLREAHAQVLRQDPALMGQLDAPASAGRALLAWSLDADAVDSLLSLAEPLLQAQHRELILLTTVTDATLLRAAGETLGAHRAALLADGVDARAAAFTSVAPGIDVARAAQEHDVDLLLVDAPEGFLEDARLLAVLEHAPCDVAVVVHGSVSAGPVLVPFTGSEHDWAAVELGAWLARGTGSVLCLAGTAGAEGGRDASRLLANGSIAVQRMLGVPAEPRLVDPEPEALVAACEGCGAVLVGLTERWRSTGLGRSRTALATQRHAPAVLVRRGLRPGGLAPRGTETRYTWTVAGP